MKRRSRPAFPREGFTLVELLAAVGVLAILVLMLGQTVGLTARAIALNSGKLDATAQARLVFERIQEDLAGRPRLADLGMLFTKATGNDSFEFYSQVDGYSGARQVTAVGYRIQQTTPGRIYQLERGAVGTDWGPQSGANPLVQFLPSEPATPASSDPNYEVLANGIFRLEFCYLLNTGNLSNTAGANYQNVSAIVVGLGALDSKSRELVSDTQLQQLAADLPDSVEGQDPVSGWKTAMAQGGFAQGMPGQAVQNVRLYERTFCVP